jgi:PAS domain S-box-containing protein
MYNEIDNLYKLIAMNAQDIISFSTPDGICRYCTPSILDVLGYEPEEIIGKEISHLYHKEDMKALRKQTFSDNDVVTFRVLHKNGYYIWVESTFRRIQEPAGMVGITRDITQRIKHDQNLAAAQRIASIGSWERELSSNVVSCSDEFFRIYDMKPSDFKGSPQELHMLVHPEDRNFFLSEVERCLAGIDLNIEYRFIKSDGSFKYLHARGSISEDKQRMYGTIQDITDQKEMLRAMHEAETTNRAKSEFLAMMSHEIRTPLNGVLGMASLLLETNLDKTQKEYTEIIQTSGNALLSIISDILDFSKIEAGKTELLQEPFDVLSCIKETFDVLSSQAREKDLDLIYMMDQNVPSEVIGDYGLLRQILLNLVGNGLKFTTTGSITVETRLLFEDLEKVTLEFRVKDTGIGIPPDKIKHLFEPFRQLDHFMTRKYGGTGLGLAISKKLVELMGGQIYLDDTREQGATFVFTMTGKKISTMVTAHPDKLEARDTTKHTLRILIAEDDEISQLVLKKMLMRFGHDVDIVSNGWEALEAISLEDYDMLFMDLQMPEMDGFEATRRLRETSALRVVPTIIAVTANAFVEDRETCLAAGMDDYISKPIKLERVQEVIAKYTDNQYR